MAYGSAFGTTLTDLGRNLVASETTRNQLQAALAAAAAQENIARTAAGSSRYATDAQKQANDLNYALKIMEDERLRASTERQAGLTEQDIALRKAIGEKQYALNTPTETALNRESQLAIAKIVGEAEANRLNRVDPRYAQTELEINAETQKTIDALPGLEARANAESEALWNDRTHWYQGDATEQINYRTKAFQIPANPAYGAFGNYLVPEVMSDGRVRFKAHLPALLRGRTAPVISPTAGPTAALSPAGQMLSAGSAPLPSSTAAPIDIAALARIVGGASQNAAPGTVTMLPTNRAAAMAATAFDPDLEDTLRKATARIQELVARGFTPQQAALKAQAEIPVAIRQRIADLQRGIAP